MISIAEKLIRYYTRIYLKLYGANIPSNLQCKDFFFRGIPKDFSIKGGFIEKGAIISKGVGAELTIGNYFFINSYSIIDCKYKIIIGDRVMIGPHCYITDFDHGLLVDLAASHHRQNKTYKEVIIADNVWIGSGAIILKGVKISNILLLELAQ